MLMLMLMLMLMCLPALCNIDDGLLGVCNQFNHVTTYRPSVIGAVHGGVGRIGGYRFSNITVEGSVFRPVGITVKANKWGHKSDGSIDNIDMRGQCRSTGGRSTRGVAPWVRAPRGAAPRGVAPCGPLHADRSTGVADRFFYTLTCAQY